MDSLNQLSEQPQSWVGVGRFQIGADHGLSGGMDFTGAWWDAGMREAKKICSPQQRLCSSACWMPPLRSFQLTVRPSYPPKTYYPVWCITHAAVFIMWSSLSQTEYFTKYSICNIRNMLNITIMLHLKCQNENISWKVELLPLLGL